MPQELVGTPFLGEFDGSSSEVAMVLVQLRLEAAEQRESIGGGASESGEDFLLVQAANLLGAMLDDGLAQRDLAISGHDDASVAADAEDGGRADSRRGSAFRRCGY